MRNAATLAFCLFLCATALGQSKPQKLQADAYGRTIISLAPLRAWQPFRPGIGLHYERILDERFKVSFYLPIAGSLRKVTLKDKHTSTFSEHLRPVGYFYPGFKFYPAGSNREVSYSLGLSLAIGFDYSAKPEKVYHPSGSSTSWVQEHSNRAGFIINNGLNIQSGRSFYFGTELGVGLSFSNSATYESNVMPLLQLNVKGGYRF